MKIFYIKGYEIRCLSLRRWRREVRYWWSRGEVLAFEYFCR